MHSFIALFVFVSLCFAADPDDRDLTGGGHSPKLHEIPSYSCHRLLAGAVAGVITTSQEPVTLVFDFDDVLVKYATRKTVPTRFAQELDGIFAQPEIKRNVRGIIILTARLSRPINETRPKRRYSEEETDMHRKEVISTTNEELQRCVPNIASILHSIDNFGGKLPDFSKYSDDAQYQKDGYGVHEEGFIYNCGLFVMGGAINSKQKLRHCKHFTLLKALEMISAKTSNILYIDDHKPWFSPFLDEGLDGIHMHLFHYEANIAEKMPVLRRAAQPSRVIPASHIHYSDTYEDDSLPSIKTMFKTALRYVATAALVYCVFRPIDSFRNLRIVRLCERVFLWALHLTFNCMKRVAFKILNDK